VRFRSILVLAAGLLMGMASLAQCDNYLKNADFSEGSQLWRGDGQAAFLNPDGTEASEGDPGSIPVIKVTLSKSRVHAVYQEFELHDAPSQLHIKLDVYASNDFKRSNRASDYNTDDFMTSVDFMMRMMPDYYERTASLKPGEWVTVQGVFKYLTGANSRTIFFMIPPGDGTVYIRNASVTP
jgi:hypothetical protein